VQRSKLTHLGNGILVAARKGTHDQGAGVGGTRVDRDLVGVLDNVNDLVQIRKVQVGAQSLGVQVQSQGDNIDVAGALAVAKQASLDTVSAGHLGQLGRSDGGASVIVVVNTDADGLALVNVPAKVLNLVGKDVGRGQLDGGGQIDDEGVLNSRAPGLADGIADLDGKVGVGVGEALGAKLKLPVGVGAVGVVLGQGADELGAADGELEGVLLGVVEDDAAEALAGGEVDVDDGILGAGDGLDGALDQVGAAGGQDLDGHVVGDGAGGVDQAAGKVKVGLRGGGEGDFNFLEANLAQHLEEAPFLLSVHWRGIALVAIAQTGLQPPRGLFNRLGGPLAVGEVEGGERSVFFRGVLEPAGISWGGVEETR
jgi:hypothetical protein